MNQVYGWKDAPEAQFAVIGHPIAHSLSPKMHAAAFAARGLLSKYVAIEVHPEEVHEALDRLLKLGYRGVNVTVPHKEEAFLWCDETTSIAQRLKVCNTLDLKKRLGTSTDGVGFQRSLTDYPFENRNVLVLGAGGSARSIIESLQVEGWSISVWNRTKQRAVDLVSTFGFDAEVIDEPLAEGKSLIVNTTSASLGGHHLPINWSWASPDALAYDLAYGQGLTTFLIDAQTHGMQLMDGRRMLMEQGAAAFEFWWNIPAPRKEMLAALQ